MQNIVSKILVIVVILVLCGWGLWAKGIKYGADLQGGVSLIYRINLPPDADPDLIIPQTISVLADRVNPTGVLDIAFRQLGKDRIEVVMPLPDEKIGKLSDAYQDALTLLLDESQIIRAELDAALENGAAVERFCGDQASGSRFTQVSALQEAFDEQRSAAEALRTAETGGEPQAIATAQMATATADIKFDGLIGRVLKLSLNRAQVIRTLGLSQKQDNLVENGVPVVDPVTDEIQTKPSDRTVAFDGLKDLYPSVASRIDTLVSTYDTYQGERTGLDDPEDLIRLLQGAGVLEFHIAVPTAGAEVNVPDMRAQLRDIGPDNVDRSRGAWFPINELKQWYDGPEQLASLQTNPGAFFASRGLVVEAYEGEYYMLLYTIPGKQLTPQDGEWAIERTYRSADNLGRPAVAFNLDSAGGQRMATLTGANVGKPMAIVLDGQVFTAPTLQSLISSNGIITGQFSQAEVSYLIKVLAAGALEGTLSSEPIAINTLGPTIGKDNLARGMNSFKISIAIVIVFMLCYYFFAGFVADLALLANGLIIFGVMAVIDGTFTLPGLAGIVLTIGMAVDANVLIYERIREEIFGGEEDIRAAIRIGYAKALSTIIDANVTNLIVCLVLLKTATAEIKGFALTLTIGICATLFTALFVTRVIYTLYTEVFKVRSLPMLPTVIPAIHRFLEPSINWISLRGMFWTASTVAVVVAIGFVSMRGVDMFDTEFRGGVTATMVTAKTGDDGERIWLSEESVIERIQGIAAGTELTAAEGDPLWVEQASRQELANASIQTSGVTTVVDGKTMAQSFIIKVANPKGIDENESITNDVVNAVVGEFSKGGNVEIDIQPSRSFDGTAATALRDTQPYVTEIEDRGEFKGGARLVFNDIDPPITVAEMSDRIEHMRRQNEFERTGGRRTQVNGITAAPGREMFSSLEVLVYEPALSAVTVETGVWFQQLAAPEFLMCAQGLKRQSSLQHVSGFSSSVAATLAANATVAVILSLVGILGYIWLRFGSIWYSVAAIVALIHDVAIALGLLAASSFIAGTGLGDMLGIAEFRIDLGVVAAMLTIIGYSLNDTIVILDRIRENRGKRPMPTAEIVNRSINQTVSRTLLTSATTIMAVGIMYSQGGTGIRPFAFCLLAGLIVGTYSSVAIAAPLVFRGHDPGALTGADAESAEEEEPKAELAGTT